MLLRPSMALQQPGACDSWTPAVGRHRADSFTIIWDPTLKFFSRYGPACTGCIRGLRLAHTLPLLQTPCPFMWYQPPPLHQAGCLRPTCTGCIRGLGLTFDLPLLQTHCPFMWYHRSSLNQAGCFRPTCTGCRGLGTLNDLSLLFEQLLRIELR